MGRPAGWMYTLTGREAGLGPTAASRGIPSPFFSKTGREGGIRLRSDGRPSAIMRVLFEFRGGRLAGAAPERLEQAEYRGGGRNTSAEHRNAKLPSKRQRGLTHPGSTTWFNMTAAILAAGTVSLINAPVPAENFASS